MSGEVILKWKLVIKDSAVEITSFTQSYAIFECTTCTNSYF